MNFHGALKQTCINCLASPVEPAGEVTLQPEGGEEVVCVLCRECAPLFYPPTRATFVCYLPRALGHLRQLLPS
jgi:hypothetical protein